MFNEDNDLLGIGEMFDFDGDGRLSLDEEVMMHDFLFDSKAPVPPLCQSPDIYDDEYDEDDEWD